MKWWWYVLPLTAIAPLTGANMQPPRPNYDESRVPAYDLPDPLVASNGERITSSKAWLDKRRPELIRIFEENVYGRGLGDPKSLSFETLSVSRDALEGAAVRKQVRVRFSPQAGGPAMTILLYLPAHAREPVPVFVGLNFEGNQTVQSDPGILLPTGWMPNAPGMENNKATEATRGSDAHSWPVSMIVAHGYGVATVYAGDIAPDHTDNFGEGVFPLFYRPGQTKPEADEWGTVAAWAWGLSRIVDYLETDRDVDKRRLIVIGHSRMGKAALWAGAQDTRFALVVSNDSGEGGAALARRKFGERTEDLNTRFPHWFCANYKQYNGKEETLPVDSNELLALVAPRPLYVASAEDDQWADPKGEFLGAKGATPVYRLFGEEGLGAEAMPPPEQPIMTIVGYHVRHGKHAITEYDWTQYINFADKQLKRNAPLDVPLQSNK
jgi:hypothetical protein